MSKVNAGPAAAAAASYPPASLSPKRVSFSKHITEIPTTPQPPKDDSSSSGHKKTKARQPGFQPPTSFAAMKALEHKHKHRPKSKQNKTPKPQEAPISAPKSTKESILGDMSRFTQESYICPFCGVQSPKFLDQLQHLSTSHPWYSLDIHEGIR
ncbi:hypothetical protein GQ54DRAFT_311401 [Martensiomyces pterosporus]|nr:hypothetical protein GQ54DRAFT_311401 [Martensiomyces pterosporus]